MILNIKARIAALEMTNNDVIRELSIQGIESNPPDFSNSINSRLKTPKAKLILSLADNILKEFEKEKEKDKSWKYHR